MAVKNVWWKMVLHDLNFPDDLMDRCKEFSGKATGTSAVKETLYKLFEVYERSRGDRLKLLTSDRKLEGLLDALMLSENAKTILESAIRKARDPNAFYLEDAK